MSREQEYGRAVPVPVDHLPELAFDMAGDRPAPSGLGKTDAPVSILPELPFDLQRAEPVPALQLSLQLRPGMTPTEVALDLFRLYTAVNQLELTHLGAGLILADALCDATPTNGEIQVTLKPADPSGAAERLTKIVSVINGAAAIKAGVRLEYRSIERCEAKVVQVAA